jgi:hypothetical protein
MGGYDSTGQAWCWEIPLECHGCLTLNGLEYLASIIIIKWHKQSTSNLVPCVLSLLDSTSTLGWLHHLSFDLSTHSIKSSLARHLADLKTANHACLYSQHIPGTQNVIVDSLSRDFHIPSNTLSTLIRFNFQVSATLRGVDGLNTSMSANFSEPFINNLQPIHRVHFLCAFMHAVCEGCYSRGSEPLKAATAREAVDFVVQKFKAAF